MVVNKTSSDIRIRIWIERVLVMLMCEGLIYMAPVVCLHTGTVIYFFEIN